MYRVLTGSMAKHDSSRVVVEGPPLPGIMPSAAVYVIPAYQPPPSYPSTRVEAAPKTRREA